MQILEINALEKKNQSLIYKKQKKSILIILLQKYCFLEIKYL